MKERNIKKFPATELQFLKKEICIGAYHAGLKLRPDIPGISPELVPRIPDTGTLDDRTRRG